MSKILQKIERKLIAQQQTQASAPMDNSELLESINDKLAALLDLQAAPEKTQSIEVPVANFDSHDRTATSTNWKATPHRDGADRVIHYEVAGDNPEESWRITPVRDAADKILYCEITSGSNSAD